MANNDRCDTYLKMKISGCLNKCCKGGTYEMRTD
jgi:hypothetical protein